MSAFVPGRTWFNSRQGGFSNGQGLVIEPTESPEKYIGLWVAVDGDGPAVQLTAKQAREVAGELEKRANLIDSGPVDAEIVDEEKTA